MNKIRLVGMAIGFLSCLYALSARAQTPTSLPSLATADWSVKQEKVLNAESNDAVWKFVNYLWGNDDLGPGNGKLCEFHFADLRNLGQLDLVISYDSGGTGDCNEVAIFDRSQEEFDFLSVGDFSFDSIEDLNGDGRYELVVDGGFAGGGSGTRPLRSNMASGLRLDWKCL